MSDPTASLSPAATTPLRRRFSPPLILRIVLALPGGYGVASLAASALALSLPLPQLDAAVAGIMVAFVLHVLCVLWVFGCTRLRRATTGMLLAAAASALWLLAVQGGPAQ